MMGHKVFRTGGIRHLLACWAAVLTAVAMLVPSVAWAGGSEDHDNNSHGGGGGEFHQYWAYKDDMDGAFGEPNRKNVLAAMGSVGKSSDGSTRANDTIDAVTSGALSKCRFNFDAHHPDQIGNAKCRLAGVGFVTGAGDVYNAYARANADMWAKNWTSLTSGKTYSNQGAEYRTNESFWDQPDTSVNSLAQAASGSATAGTLGVIVLDQYEPKPAEYSLSVSTSQQAPFGLVVGAGDEVRDQIHASRNGSPIIEDVNADVTLHYDGQADGYVPANESTKTGLIHNNGDSLSPPFVPSDLGMNHWQEGAYRFDVNVRKQGKMSADVNHVGFNDPAEQWFVTSLPPPAPTKQIQEGTSVNGMANTTAIKSYTGRGGYEMHFKDVISANGVNYDVSGMKVMDLTAETDVSNQFVMVWDRGLNMVSADTVAGIGQLPLDHEFSFTFQVIVHDPDTSVVADIASVSWNKNGFVDTPLYQFLTRDPNPDKTWTTDPNEALATADPGHANNSGADGRTFVPGDRVSSVVNGVLPKDLVQDLSQYSLTDDWTGASQYVDFPNENTKVYVDGVDRTGDFIVTTVGSKTVASAKPSILVGSAHQTNDRKVKLVLDGRFKSEASATEAVSMTNSGGEKWNGQDAATNTPPVLMRSPNPNKVWTADPAMSMDASDSHRTNRAGSDNCMFVPGERISTVVNGTLPKNLAKDLSRYSITDDWSQAANYLDFPNDNAKVYVDGVERTGDFLISTDGHVTTASARPSILSGSGHRANDRKVKLILDGTFNIATDAHNLIDGIKNKGAEQWNGKTAATNEPTVQVRSPNPNKAWATDPAEAMGVVDTYHTNQEGSDNRMFVPGEQVSTVVNGTLPKNLTKDLSRYSIADDWSQAAEYLDFPGGRAKVYVDGVDRTGEFVISANGHVTTARAKPSILSDSAHRASDRKVKLILDGTFNIATDAHNLIDRITNKGTEQWNGKTAAANEPIVQVRSPNPNKAWVKDTQEALSVSDVNHTNDVAADGKTYVTGDDAAVVVTGALPKNLAKDLSRYSIADDWTGAAQYVDFPNAKARVYVDGVDRTSDFSIATVGHTTTANAKSSILRGSGKRINDRKVKLVLSGRMYQDLDVHTSVALVNKGYEQWNGKSAATNEPQVHVWTPNPDKSWVKLDDNGKWRLVIDPNRTNATGGDNLTFLDGDQIGAVVNVPIADPSSLEYGVNTLKLSDDYGKADYLVDPQALSNVRMYVADAASGARSSVDAINDVAGADVSSHFDVTQDGTVITASAKKDWLAELSRHTGPVQVTMLVPFRVNYANGRGAKQVREDFGKQPGEELSFSTDAGGADLLNAASIQINRQKKDTNMPRIAGYVPSAKKDVVGEASEGGSQDSIDGKVVYPGQKVEYNLDTQPHLPAGLAYQVKTVTLTDQYDQYLEPDKQTLELIDLNSGRMVSKSKYATTWDLDAHQVAVNFTDAALIAQWRSGGTPRLQLRFEGIVSLDAPVDHQVNNQWGLILNNSFTPSNEVFNIPPSLRPAKHDFQSQEQGDPSVSIDGKTLLMGDTGNYVIDLDATQTSQAYNVWRLGVVDDFDEEYLKVDPTGITVTGDDGRDHTAKFNIQVLDGVAYAFAKQVDTFVTASGETLKGDPQPKNLKDYADSDVHNPLADPAIDQALLGQHYHITIPYTVQKVADGYVVKNKAVQVENALRKESNEVSNPLKPMNPAKDVVVKVGGGSVNGSSVYKGSVFLYRLDSTILPADRAYPDIKDWSIVDDLDPAYDQYTGQWAVYATRDLHAADGGVMAYKGDRIAGSGFDAIGKFGDDLFTLVADDGNVSPRSAGEKGDFKSDSSSPGDSGNAGKQMKITVAATELYRRLVSADTVHEQGWQIYIQVKRVKSTERHENKFIETLNGHAYESNVAWTCTPELVPALYIEKWDKPSGWAKGDRDHPEEALDIVGDTEIVFTITNTSDEKDGHGAQFKASDLKIADTTLAGDGIVTDFKYPKDWSSLILKPGEHVDVVGTLKDVTAKHADRAKVTGTPLVEISRTSLNPWGADSGDEGTSDGIEINVPVLPAPDQPLHVDNGFESPILSDSVAMHGAHGEVPNQWSSDDFQNTKIVNVAGRSMAMMEPVDSNLDDWNGQRIPQPEPEPEPGSEPKPESVADAVTAPVDPPMVGTPLVVTGASVTAVLLLAGASLFGAVMLMALAQNRYRPRHR
ncbi:LPXTG cell wall anchor domain-containing protein [Bifidobacterium sp. ESL0745]|uniref:LPXTG cell wall anchor domain-containing protein n=1 Tax=Bifidobacterium sp. ESL0745 TaxID=2983226 RepID=UPI0023F766DD|nr:LPXTG cell wall anchor domain-containing protein [Bifidobacterium sp. ESL0745]MDF7665649.1 LPXTG cell wall anchor domain-containing protein [Bifidobacterium sp. ESL0745]